jgi:hypothetical protein
MHHEDDYDNNDDASKPVCEPVQKFRAVVFLRILGFCVSLGDFSGGAAAFQIGDAVGLFGNRPFCIFERLSNCGLVGCQFGLGTGNPLLAEAIIHALGNLEWGAIGQITVCPFNEFAERENLDSTPSDCPRQRDGVVAAIQYDYHNLYLTGGAVLVTEYDGGCAVINGRAQ